MGPNEPYWRTNSSFSPPPTRWDFRFQSEGLPYGVNDGMQLYGSSTSSNGKESRGWVRGNHLYDLHYSASDGTGIFLSSPSDLSQGPQWTPPAIQEISIDDYETLTRKESHPSASRVSFIPTKEGTSANPNSRGSMSSQSESSESESTTKSHLSSQRNFSNHRSFISKPIHPMSFHDHLTTARDAFDPAVTDFTEFDTSTPLRDGQHWSSASSSQEFADVTESFELETPGHPHIPPDGFRCGLCERFLSQRSPWSSRRIVRSGDMPTIGVLPCCHAFHAECLEQATPKTRKSDPPCPVCVKLEEENSTDQRGLLRSRNGPPRLKSCEDGPSRPWGCAQVGDCVEGALHAPPRNAMFLLNRNRIKKNLSLKGNISKEFPGKVKKSGTYSSQMFSGSSADQEAVGCSKASAGSSVWR
ncbi:uncharacterized protein LOC113868880 [Abrus precatorius]|uniref:Uncharacterized protein LOC113868880 n=1 Tax=Abrus precatorius TaxID=3816 RepID=A0A8B8LYG6_ABRPR|nr:uncharacterized protein LOC113868880 [Abrus precatorius]